ncbi:MAG: nuclear transport factor 2 family protein [Sphingomonadales bacterium]|nr:nuclear transport factor 2 family protein [Sphingomonadales bacterium]
MLRSRFDEYIARFNARDAGAFDDFLRPDVTVINGHLEIPGVEAMKAHYVEHIWPHFEERLTPLRFVSDEDTLAVQMWTRFTAQHVAETIFGPVETGDRFDYRGVILYELRDDRFATIIVAYNSFTRTTSRGEVSELGIVH